MSLSLFSRSAFRFAQDGAPLLVLDDVTIELPGGSPFAIAPVFELPATGDAAPQVAVPAPAQESAPAADATPPVAPPPVAEAAPPAQEAPPLQSQAELDLFAQFAQLADGFDGDQALANLLASDWAAQNGWQGAGGGPIA